MNAPDTKQHRAHSESGWIPLSTTRTCNAFPKVGLNSKFKSFTLLLFPPSHSLFFQLSHICINVTKLNCTAGELDVYEKLNVVVRRKPEENNFKAVLETIRDLMLVGDTRSVSAVGQVDGAADAERQLAESAGTRPSVVPHWLHDLLLGYGDPDAAHYSKYFTTNCFY